MLVTEHELALVVGAPESVGIAGANECGAFGLEGPLVGLSVGPSAAIVEAIRTAVFVAVEDLVTSNARNAELTAQR